MVCVSKKRQLFILAKRVGVWYSAVTLINYEVVLLSFILLWFQSNLKVGIL